MTDLLSSLPPHLRVSDFEDHYRRLISYRRPPVTPEPPDRFNLNHPRPPQASTLLEFSRFFQLASFLLFFIANPNQGGLR